MKGCFSFGVERWSEKGDWRADAKEGGGRIPCGVFDGRFPKQPEEDYGRRPGRHIAPSMAQYA